VSQFSDQMLAKILEKLQQEIHERGITQTEIAKALNLPQSSVSAILSGKTRLSLEDMIMVCQRINVSLSEIASHAEKLSIINTPMPEEFEDALYKTEDHFIAGVSAAVPITPDELTTYIPNASTAKKALDDLVSVGYLKKFRNKYVQVYLDKTYQFKKTLSYREIFRKVVKRLWEYSDVNHGNKKWRQERMNYFVIDYLTEEQWKILEAHLYKTYEIMTQFSAANMLDKYQSGKKYRLWAVHVLLGTPLENK
jgi:transcriptional regulator with XRE-family HTH domain